MKTKLSFITLGLIAVSCGTNLKEAADKINDKVQDFPTTEEAEGFALYGASCGKCHKLYEVKEISAERWKQVLPPMIGKAKLDAEQGKKVTAFVNWKLAN